MKLTGKFKTQIDHAAAREEKRDTIKKAGMLLTDDELDQISGGRELVIPEGYCSIHGRYKASPTGCPDCNPQ